MRRFLILASSLALLGSGACQPKPSPKLESARRVTQAFYDQYLPLSKHALGLTILGDSGSIVAADLAALLTADYQASARDSDEVVGLDFDPFLATQDPCDVYRAEPGSLAGDTVLIPVHAICGGKRDSTVAAIVELVGGGETWSLVNLKYPGEQGDLRGVLASLAKDREGHDSTARK